jgi:hypothetical protein
MPRLYQLTEAYADLVGQLEDCQTEEERFAVLEALDAIGSDIADKGEAYARIMRNSQAEAEALDKEIRRLTAKKKAAENTVERLKSHMLFALGLAGANELRTTIGKWRVQQNPPKVEILDETEIPEEFFVPQPPKLMNSLIMAHWKETGEIPDGCDIVHAESVRFG